MKICAFVPAKGDSDRVNKKNFRILDGEYLFKRKIKQLLSSKLISEVWLDTESDEMIKLVEDLPVKILKRPLEKASNDTDGHELFEFESSSVPYADVIVQALCTAPFVDEFCIDRALEKLISSTDYDSLVAINKKKHYKWENNLPLYGLGRIPNSSDLTSEIIESMSLYAVKNNKDGNSIKKRFGRRPFLFELTAKESIDINHEVDLDFAEEICAGIRAKKNLKMNALSTILTTSIISDICKSISTDVMLPSNIKPLSQGRLFGYAKTISITDIPKNDKDDSNWRKIFDALDSYEFIRPGDIIVVDNQVKERAYFGDLNATLAIKNGAIGAIINGFTRDVEKVQLLQFPVYACGSYANDVKYDGIFSYMNESIKVGKISIKNSDIIFADHDGVCVIPLEIWDKIEPHLYESVEKETKVKINAIKGMKPKNILKSIGEF